MKYIYDKNGKYKISVYDEVTDDDIKRFYPNHYISNRKYDYAKIEIDQILPMSNIEVEQEKYNRYQKKEYELQKDEIIEKNRIKKIKLKEYQYIKNGKIYFDFEKKRNDLMETACNIHNKNKCQDIIYGETYTIPISNNNYRADLFNSMSLYSIIGIPKRINIRMYDSDGKEKYIEITDGEYKKILNKINMNKTEAMSKYLRTREFISQMEQEELESFELTDDFQI